MHLRLHCCIQAERQACAEVAFETLGSHETQCGVLEEVHLTYIRYSGAPRALSSRQGQKFGQLLP